MNRWDKSGQFYLIAAMVIIALMAGVILITNSSKKSQENTRVEKLAEELQIESGKILDQGANTGSYKWNSFTSNFSDYAGIDVEIVYLIANRTTPPVGPEVINSQVFLYDDDGNKIINPYPSFLISSTPPVMEVQKYNTNYSFVIRKGENFYFIISQEINDEVYVATN